MKHLELAINTQKVDEWQFRSGGGALEGKGTVAEGYKSLPVVMKYEHVLEQAHGPERSKWANCTVCKLHLNSAIKDLRE